MHSSIKWVVLLCHVQIAITLLSFSPLNLVMSSQKLKKAKRAALHKTPVTLKRPQSGGSSSTGVVGGTPTKLPPAKKRKQSDSKCLIPPTDPKGGGGMQPLEAKAAMAAPILSNIPISTQDAPQTIHTINLPSRPGGGQKTPPKSETDEGGGAEVAPPPPKEPPVLPAKLSPALLVKVTNLEQVHT